MNEDSRSPYRDGLDRDQDVHTDMVTEDAGANIAAERARLERNLTVAGKALLDAADELIASLFVDPMEAAALVVKLTEHLTARQHLVITKLVVDAKVPTREVAKRLDWSPAAVAFACKARRHT